MHIDPACGSDIITEFVEDDQKIYWACGDCETSGLISISAILQGQELLQTSTTGQIIEHTYYTLSYSEDHEIEVYCDYQ